MTLDTSAILAVLQDEAERSEFVSLIEEAPRRLISTVSVLEASMVLEGRRGNDAGTDLDLFLHRASIETVPFDDDQLGLARVAPPEGTVPPPCGLPLRLRHARAAYNAPAPDIKTALTMP